MKRLSAKTLLVAPCTLYLGLVLCGLASPASLLLADDWPQAQGPLRDNKSAETGLLKNWPEGGPELLWTFKNAGTGYSGPAITGDRIYLMGGRGGKAELFALDVDSGKEVWSAPVNKEVFDFKGNSWGTGPRATPTVAEGLIFAIAGDGELMCADANGKIQWRTNMVTKLRGSIKNVGAGEPKTVGWGFCWAPLVDGEKVICVPGGPQGMVAALDRTSGKVLWRSAQLKEEATYSSPILATVDGVRQYVVMTQLGVAGVAAEDGDLLWHYQRSRPYPDVVIPTPAYHDNHVYVSAGYGAGCDLIKLTTLFDGSFSATKVYANRLMKNTLGGFVLHEGYIYGCSDRRGWICQDFKTGLLKWSKRGAGGLGDGSIIYADHHLYLYSERGGEVALVEASSTEWVEKGRFRLPEMSKLRAPSGRNWTHPVIAGGKLYLRDQELLFCYKIK